MVAFGDVSGGRRVGRNVQEGWSVRLDRTGGFNLASCRNPLRTLH